MTSHANDIVVGEVVDNTVVVTIDSQLSPHIQELRKHLEGELTVTNAVVNDSNEAIIASFETEDQPYTLLQIRTRIANRCRDWVRLAARFDGVDEIHVELVERTQHPII